MYLEELETWEEGKTSRWGCGMTRPLILKRSKEQLYELKIKTSKKRVSMRTSNCSQNWSLLTSHRSIIDEISPNRVAGNFVVNYKYSLKYNENLYAPVKILAGRSFLMAKLVLVSMRPFNVRTWWYKNAITILLRVQLQEMNKAYSER